MKKYQLERFDTKASHERKALILETARDIINQSPSIQEIDSSKLFEFNPFLRGKLQTFLKLPAISFILDSLSVHNTYIVNDNVYDDINDRFFFLEMAIKYILNSEQDRYDLFYKDDLNHDRLISYTTQPDGKKYFVITDSLGNTAKAGVLVNRTILKVIKGQDITLLSPGYTAIQKDSTNCGIFTLDALTHIQKSPELLQAIIANENEKLPIEMQSLNQYGAFNSKASDQKSAYLLELTEMFCKVPDKLGLLSILNKYDLPFLFREIVNTFVAIFSNKQVDYIEESVTDITKLISEYTGDTSMLMLNDFFIEKATISPNEELPPEILAMINNFTLEDMETLLRLQVASDSVDESLGEAAADNFVESVVPLGDIIES